MGYHEPNAMVLATVSVEAQPSQRTVLLKALDQKGLVFYTNYESQKSQELLQNSKVSVIFFWNTLARQIRVEGVVEKASPEESDHYFSSRARLSQLGAWASPQSRPIPGTQWLLNKVAEFDSRFLNQKIPRPPHWGGWRIKPHKFEFWFGRDGRLHERFIYDQADSSILGGSGSVSSPSWRKYQKSP